MQLLSLFRPSFPYIADLYWTYICARIFFGTISQIDGIVEKLKQEWGKECRVIATGGFVNMLAKFSNQVETVDQNLTLDGLRMAFEKLTGK